MRHLCGYQRVMKAFAAGRGLPPAVVWCAGGRLPPAFCPDLGVGPPPEAVEVNCTLYVSSFCV